MARSVGGSGGQMSVSSGGAGAASAAGGQVDLIESAATALGGSVMAASWPWGSAGWVSDAPAAVAGGCPSATEGTVRAQSGVAFCGTAVSGLFGSWGGLVSVCAQSGSPFSMGSAGSGSASDAVSVTSGPSAGATGTVLAQIGVVSRVTTGLSGSSAGFWDGLSEAPSGGEVTGSAWDSDSKTWSV